MDFVNIQINLAIKIKATRFPYKTGIFKKCFSYPYFPEYTMCITILERAQEKKGSGECEAEEWGNQ